MNALRLLLGSCRRSVPLLSDPLMERHWAEQSALFGWSVAGLAGHFARSAFNLERAIEVAPAPDVRLMDVVDYYTCNEPQPADSTVGQRIRDLGDEEAAAGPRALIARFTDSISSLEQKSARDGLPPAVTLFGSPMSLDECAAACLLELVVHADDLAVSTVYRCLNSIWMHSSLSRRHSLVSPSGAAAYCRWSGHLLVQSEPVVASQCSEAGRPVIL